MSSYKEYMGEFFGTLILVFIGCSAVAVAVVFQSLNLYGVAWIFGLGVALAIYTVRGMGPAHLNPAVSLAMVFAKELSVKKLALYMLFQFLGALAGSALLLLIFNQSIIDYELSIGIVRGSEESYRSAMMFGEYFPNPAFEDYYQVSHLKACFMEGLGTFVLIFVIFRLMRIPPKYQNYVPLLIGLTVTALIIFIAPYTQGGFNPARDFSPRITAYFGGWGIAAFPEIPISFSTVYIFSPLLGGLLAAGLHRKLVVSN